jgi:hypothetical protein
MEGFFAWLGTLITSILGNLLTPRVKQIFGRWINFDPPKLDPAPLVEPEPVPTDPLSEEEQEAIRAHNRARLEAFSGLVILYGMTFFSLYQAFATPLRIKMLGAQSLNLSQTRLGWNLSLDATDVTLIALAFAIALYLPLLSGAQRIAHYVAVVWNRLQRVSPFRFSSFIYLAFFVLALLVCGHWVYVFYPQFGYGQAVGMPFVIMVVAFMFFASNQKR